MAKQAAPRVRRAAGEGSVRYVAARDLYEGRASYVDADGKRQRRSVYAKTQREAAAKLRELNADIAAGIEPTRSAGKGHTVTSWARVWADDIAPLAVSAGTTRQATVDTYATHLRVHVLPVIGAVKLDAVKLDHVRRVLRQLDDYRKPNGDPLGSSAKRQTLLALRVLLDAAMTDRLIARNVARDIKLPRQTRAKGEPSVLSGADVAQLLSTLTGADRVLVLTYLATGARRSELSALTWDRVDLDAATIDISASKTAAGVRLVAIPDQLVSELRAWRKTQAAARLASYRWDDPQLVFPNSVGAPRDPRWITRRVSKLLTDAGLSGSTHTLRHTFATLTLNAGAAPGDVASQLGHASPRTTLDMYVHATTAGKRHAAQLIGNALGL